MGGDATFSSRKLDRSMNYFRIARRSSRKLHCHCRFGDKHQRQVPYYREAGTVSQSKCQCGPPATQKNPWHSISVTDISVCDIAMPTANRIPDDLQGLLPLTPAVFFILFALADGEKHGYAIMQTVSRISENQFRMGPGTLYTTIQRLLDLDVIEETEGAGDQSEHENRRRYYKLTRAGKAVLAADVSRMESVVRLARNKKLLPRTSE
jgi:DNA-binding PadR family transcriptional regulator